MGYTSLVQFIYSMPDIIRIEKRNDSLILKGIPTEKSMHISKLVAEQKTTSYKGRSQKPSRYYPNASPYNRTQIPPHILEWLIDFINEWPDGVEKDYLLQELHSYRPELRITMKDLEEEFRKFPSRIYQGTNMVYPVKPIQNYNYTAQNTNNTNRFKSAVFKAAGYEENTSSYDDDESFESVLHPNRFNSSHETSTTKPISSFFAHSVSTCQNEYKDNSPQTVSQVDTDNSYKDSNGVTSTHVEVNNNLRTDEVNFIRDSDDQIIINEKLSYRLKRLIEKYPQGIWCSDLPKKYSEEYGYSLQYTELGFTSVIEFTSYLTDIFQCMKIKETGDFKLFPVNKNLPSFASQELSDEAVPTKLSHNTIMAFMPKDVMGFGDRISFIKPDNFVQNKSFSWLEVVVSDVFTPTFFWVQLRKWRAQFRDMMDHLNYFYSKEYKQYIIQPIVIEEGLNCACKYNGIWHRAVIEKVSPDYEIIVMFYDYGTLMKCKPEDVYYLLKEFNELPAQAIPSGLYNVMPCKGSKWTFTVSDTFARRTCDRYLIARIMLTSTENNSMMIILTDTSEDVDVHINDWLVNEKLAVYGTKMNKVDMDNILLYIEENLLYHRDKCYEAESETFDAEKNKTKDRNNANVPLILPQSTLDDTAFKPSSESLLRDQHKTVWSEENVQNQNSPSFNLYSSNGNNTNPFLQDEPFVYKANLQEFFQLWNENLVVLEEISETLNLLLNKHGLAEDEDTLNKVRKILLTAYTQIPFCADPMNAGLANICKDTIISINSRLRETGNGLMDYGKNRIPLSSISSNKNNNFNEYPVPVRNCNNQKSTGYPNCTNTNNLIPANLNHLTPANCIIPSRKNWECETFDQNKFRVDVQNYFTNNDSEHFTHATKLVDSNTPFKETNPFRADTQASNISEKKDSSFKDHESISCDVINIENSTIGQYVNRTNDSNSTSSNSNEYLKLYPTNNDTMTHNSVARYNTNQSQSLDDITSALSNIVISDERLPRSSIPKESTNYLSISKDCLSGLRSTNQEPIYVDTFVSWQSATNQNRPMNSFKYPVNDDGHLTLRSTSCPLTNSTAIVKSSTTPQYNNHKLKAPMYNGLGGVYEKTDELFKRNCETLNTNKYNWTPVQPIYQDKTIASSDNSKTNGIQTTQNLAIASPQLDSMGLQNAYAKQWKFKSDGADPSYLHLNTKVSFQAVELQNSIAHIFYYQQDGWLLLNEFVEKFTHTSCTLLPLLTDLSLKFVEIDRTKCSVEFLPITTMIFEPTLHIINGVTRLYLVSLTSAVYILHKLEIIPERDINAIFRYTKFPNDSVAHDLRLIMSAYERLKRCIEQSE